MTTPSGRVLTVGAGQEFSTLSSAVAASQDGDVIAVQAGTYSDDPVTVSHSVTIEGVGGLAHLQGTHDISNDKALIIDDAADLTIENMEFSGATVSDGNGAGIRYEAGNLVVENSYFHDDQDGILGGAVTGGNVTIDGSTFVHDGAGDGQTHGAYLGRIATLTVTNSFFQDMYGGSDVKSRAAATLVANNKFIDTDTGGDTNYQVDLPEGGNDTVEGNLVLKGYASENRAIVHFGGEIANPTGSLLVQDNQFYSHYDPAVAILNQTGLPVALIDNGMDQHVSIPVDKGTATATIDGNTLLTGPDPSTALELPGGIVGSVTVPVLPLAPSADFLAAATPYTMDSASPMSLADLTGNNSITVSGAGGSITADSGQTAIAITADVTGPTSFNAIAGDHTVAAAAGNNTLSGGGGSDVFVVTGGDNMLTAVSGTNYLSAANGNDTLIGGSGSDTLSSGGTGSHMIVAGSGTSQIAAGATSDVIFTGSGQSQVSLGWGVDWLVGGSGNSTISGGDGPSIIKLGSGATDMSNGAGLTAVFAQGSGNATFQISDGGGSLVIAGYDPSHMQLIVPHQINGLTFSDPSQIPTMHDAQGDTVLYLGSNSHGPEFVVLVGTSLDPSQITLA